ncbi:histidine phosphatase family protein [Pusillimonas caeni]|uniref:SixA phosphatase family protein n=1 Tax=Pusillimonas caeni TaxID=1348472 RepID=UPI000E59C846|nr:histidine phosphatase family protein [Pusillimonas caeni]TFL11363.1 histidine phosphatase family protein [Pusillimonas caeni]
MPAPSRRLFLLRHAEADRPPGTSDHERPLSAQGRDDAASMGVYLAQAGLLPQMALVSTSTRTRSTWELVQKALPELVPAMFERRIYESTQDAILAAIRGTADEHESLVVVGHNPGMHRLALHLIGRADRNAFARLHSDYPPGALAVIDFEVDGWTDVAEHGGTLERFATPASQSD